MSNISLWLVLSGILLIAEITTGTFYLLMVSLGAAAAALLAYLGFGLELQIATAAIISVAGSLLLKNRSARRSNQDRRNDLLDIGNTLDIAAWSSEGRTNTHYRGSQWAAESVDTQPLPGLHQIVDVQGSILKVKKISKPV